MQTPWYGPRSWPVRWWNNQWHRKLIIVPMNHFIKFVAAPYLRLISLCLTKHSKRSLSNSILFLFYFRDKQRGNWVNVDSKNEDEVSREQLMSWRPDQNVLPTTASTIRSINPIKQLMCRGTSYTNYRGSQSLSAEPLAIQRVPVLKVMPPEVNLQHLMLNNCPLLPSVLVRRITNQWDLNHMGLNLGFSQMSLTQRQKVSSLKQRHKERCVILTRRSDSSRISDLDRKWFAGIWSTAHSDGFGLCLTRCR